MHANARFGGKPGETLSHSMELEQEEAWPVSPKELRRLAGQVTTAAVQREQMAVCAPALGVNMGTVPNCTAADVDTAVTRARNAQAAWARRSIAERAPILLRFHDLVLRRREHLMDVIQLESGKARRDALEEVLDVAINARYYARHGPEYLAPRRRRGALPLVTAAWENRRPIGVVGIIAPWNYPLTLAVSDALPALLAGNAVVLKPAQYTPYAGLAALELLREAGLPPNLFQVVTGAGSDLGEPLIASVDFVCFTGSTATGRIVARQAGQHMIQTSMELGGKNPMLVLADANLERAVVGAIRGAFANAGQLCIAMERLYVQRPLYDRFVERLATRMRQLELGFTFDYGPEMGSLTAQEQLEKTREHVEDAVARGATVLAGGRARPDLGPFFYEPTLLAGVTPEMKVFGEETFGPVLSIYPFDGIEEAIAAANDTQYGLNGSIWTRDVEYGRTVAARLRVGSVNINESYAAAWGSVDAPMGGMKASGVGRRHGREGIWRYTEPQTVAVQHLVPLGPVPGVHPRIYETIVVGMLKLMRYLPGLG